MRLIIALFNILLFVSCSTKKDDIKTNEGAQLNLVDSILFEGKYSFKRTLRDDGKPIYIKEITDFYSVAGTEKKIIVKSTLTVTETPSWYPQYNLILEGYDLANLEKPIWKKELENESPIGVWNDYFETIQYGCCASENGNSFYSLNNGKQILKFSGEPKHFLNDKFFIYHSVSATNFEHSPTDSINGLLYCVEKPIEGKKIELYTIRYIDSPYYSDIQFEYTPEIEIRSKHDLIELGFFSRGLYKKGVELKNIDTVKNYLSLNYGVSNTVLIPIKEDLTLNETDLISNNKKLSSKFFLIKNR